MTIQRLKIANAAVLANPGKRSEQIISNENAPDALVTVTRVTMEPGAISALHVHRRSEQIWLVEAGSAELLHGNSSTEAMVTGDIVRTPPGEVHGIKNTGSVPFVYLTVTCPPEDMSRFYEKLDRGTLDYQ